LSRFIRCKLGKNLLNLLNLLMKVVFINLMEGEEQ